MSKTKTKRDSSNSKTIVSKINYTPRSYRTICDRSDLATNKVNSLNKRQTIKTSTYRSIFYPDTSTSVSRVNP